jgi:hypothetical protein
MTPQAPPAALSGKWIWTGRILTGIVAAFLIFDGVIKLVLIQPVVDSSGELGWPVKYMVPIGVIDLVCGLLLAIPRTAVLGALLLTGLLGGAIATHLRVESPMLSHTLFGLYMGLIAWAGVYLREPRLRALIPLRS